MQKLGLTSVTFRQLGIDEIASLAHRAGLSHIEWGGDVHVTPGDFGAAERAVLAMKENGLSCSAYGSYYRVGDGDMAEFEKICKTASSLGAPKIRVWLGRKGSDETSADEREKMVSEVQKMSDIAGKFGQTVAFEFHGKTYNDNGASCVGFLRDVGRENVKTYWQPLAFGDSLDNLKTALDYVVTLHVFSWNEKNERFPLSVGADDWEKYLALLKTDRDYDLTMEFVKNDDPAQFLADAETLKNIVK